MTGGGKARELVAADEWFGVNPFQITVSTVHVAQANTAVHPFTTMLPWSIYSFYFNRLFRECAMKKNRLFE